MRSLKSAIKMNNNYKTSIADGQNIADLASKLTPTAQVLTIGSQNWQQALKSFNKDSETQTPAYYVKCTNENDVLQCLNFAQTNNLPITPRSGGHNLANFSLIQGGMVIDVKGLNFISHSQDNTSITYQTGCNFGDLDTYMYEKLPGYAFVTTMDPSIGTAGGRSGLGVGWLQRLIGNGIDNLISAKIALWDGTVVIANEKENTDLFKAIKGAASNFGILLELSQKIYPILDPAQGDQIRHSSHFYQIEKAQEVYDKVYQLCLREDLPDQSFILAVLGFFEGKRGLTVASVHYKYSTDLKEIDKSVHFIEEELKKIQQQFKGIPNNPLVDESGWTYVSHKILQSAKAPWGFSYYPCGGFVDRKQAKFVTSQLIKSWRQSNVPEFSSDVFYNTSCFFHFGGKKQRERNPKESAWPGNQDTFLLTVTWGGWKTPEQKEPMVSWVKNQWKNLYQHLQFGYICAAAFDWKSQSFAKFVYGENYEELRKIKQKYDPHNIFRHNVNIAPSKN